MANNVSVKDAAAATVVVKTTDVASVHTPHNNVDAVIPGTGATNLGKAEDAAHTSGDTGVMALAVRRDTAAASSGTTGDYEPLQTDSTGRLRVVQDSTSVVTALSPVFDVTLSTDTSAYASGDVIADSQVLTNIMRATDSTGVLQSVTMIDKADQKVAMTVYFLSANVSVGTENAAPSISDANSLNILGFVDIAASDWKDLGGTAVASIKGIGLGLEPASGTASVYIAVVNGTGTPTFAADSLVARLTVLQD